MLIPENNLLKKEIEEIVRLCEELDDIDGSEFSLPATKEQINAFEKDTGIEIPPLYKEWLEFTASCDIFGGLVQLFMPSADGYYNKYVSDDYVVIGTMIGDGEKIWKVIWNNKTEIYENEKNVRKLRDMNMREAFDIFWKKMNEECLKTYGRGSKVVYRETCDKYGIYVPDTITKGKYAQWQPVLQKNSVDFRRVEDELGFAINNQLKDYFSTYWFMKLIGKIDENVYSLEPITPNTNIENFILHCYQEADIDYLRPQTYCAIGEASVDGNQGYGLYVNNETSEVICVDWDMVRDSDFAEPLSKTSFVAAKSMIELLKKMEGYD